MKLSAACAGALFLALGAAAPGLATETTQGNGGDAGGLLTGLGAYEFKTYCATCHGADGTGNGPVADYVNKKPANLTTLAKRNGGIFPAERITQVIDGREEVNLHGPRDMPVWGDWFSIESREPGLDAESRESVVKARIDNLVAYVKSLQVN